MPLYERLLGEGASADHKIAIDGFQATLAELGRGRITTAQANDMIAAFSNGGPLTASEVTEVQTLANTVTGSTTAKLARVVEIDHVFILAELRTPGYNTAALVRTRLGV